MKTRTWLSVSIFLLGLAVMASLPDGRARVVFCDVGQGDGILVQKGYSQLVVDTGADNGMMSRCLSEKMPFWDKTIEGLILTHWDGDHAGGLDDIKSHYKIDNMLIGSQPKEKNEHNIDSVEVRQGDKIGMGLIEFEVVNPGSLTGEDNQDSIVGVLKIMGYRILLMGDADIETEQRLVWRKLIDEQVDVLKVSHHGSKNGTSDDLLKRVSPKIAVISVGENNYGHPTEEVLERLKKYGVTVRRTDVEGDIVIWLR